MPVTPSYPGVYIEEVPSGVRTITGVGTSIAAFLGYTVTGPINKATEVFNFGDFERKFGGLDKQSPLAYAVQQFYLNGGREARIVRVAEGASAALVSLCNGVDALPPVVLEVAAISEGSWGNLLRVEVDYNTAFPNRDGLFNLVVTELIQRNGSVTAGRVEQHRNLSMNSASNKYAEAVVNGASELVRVHRTLTPSGEPGSARSGWLSGPELGQLGERRSVTIFVDGGGAQTFDLWDLSGPPPDLANLAGNLVLVRQKIENQVAGVTCGTETANDGRLRLVVTSNSDNETSEVRFANAPTANAAGILKLGLSNGGIEMGGAASFRPVPTGSFGDTIELTTLPNTAQLSLVVLSSLPDQTFDAPLWAMPEGAPSTLEGLRSRLQSVLATSAVKAVKSARVVLVGDRLQVTAGGDSPEVKLELTAPELGFSASSDHTVNVARYAVGSTLSSAAQAAGTPGSDGTPPTTVNVYLGSEATKTGLFALEDLDLFNILCIPDQTNLALLAPAIEYVERRRAIVVCDLPSTVNSFAEAKGSIDDSENAALRHKNAVVYFPRLHFPDLLDDGRPRAFSPCGALAGLYARTDTERGVWKAPAGIDAVLRGAVKTDYLLTDQENGQLNPLALNCIRTFPVYGTVAWGSRTLVGADAMASEWKYIPVRRLALFLEESLYRGTQWVVFEPNDEPLWSQIRLSIGSFMHTLFRQGAFQGKSPREAYLIKCDAETTTQDDINLGIVNIVVGFAPLKPAEFVIIRIQQLSGQAAG